MKNKRGQGLSLNTIIIAAIALIVLVVLVMIFTGRMGGFTGGLQEATSCAQACKAAGKTGGSYADTCTEENTLVGYEEGAKLCCCA